MHADDQWQRDGGITFDGDLGGRLLYLAPGHRLPDLGPAQRAVVLGRRGQVNGVVQPSLELVPPDDVVLGDAPAHYDGAGVVGMEYDV